MFDIYWFTVVTEPLRKRIDYHRKCN